MELLLTDEQRAALAHHGHAPVFVTDPTTRERYVLVSVERYDRIRELADDDSSVVRDSYPLQEQVAHAEGWDDPIMDEYNDYDANRKGT